MKTKRIMPFILAMIMGGSLAEMSTAQSTQCPPLYTFTGAPFDEFGASVSGIGDFNGDGYDDFIIGAPGGQNEAYIYSGVDGILLCTLRNEGGNDDFGVSVSGAGDVNNDGFKDVIVGAYRNDVSGIHAGRAYVFFGHSGPFPCIRSATNADMTLTGEATNDVFGMSVAGAGDVNNDGFSDLVVGASQNGAGGYIAGRTYVFLGSSGPYPVSVAATNAYYILTGDEADARYGYPVAGIGDINLDGYDDIIIGEEGHDAGGANNGAAWVVSGRTGSVLYSFVGENPNDRHGIGVSGAGDVNGDGWPDVVVGADLYNGWTGKAYVYSGRDGSLLIDVTGEAAGDRFGHFVSDAGDINGDGFDDVLLSAYINDASGHYAGRVYVVLGSNGPFPISINASNSDLIFTGEAPNDRFGLSIASAGDINNDGTDEIIVGMVQESVMFGAQAGRAYVYDCFKIDKLTFPSVAVRPCDTCTYNNGADTGWVVQPVVCDLSQPAAGATIPVRIPSGVEVCEISFQGLITDSWDIKPYSILPDSGYLSVALANTTGLTIPTGLTTLFNILYRAPRECNVSSYIHWDTALYNDIGRQLKFADTATPNQSFGVTFDVSADSTEIQGFIPGDLDDNGTVDITDLTLLIDHLFINFPKLCVKEAGNCDGGGIDTTDIADLTYLIDHLFINFPPLYCPGSAPVLAKQTNSVSMESVYENGRTTIRVQTDVDLRGIELTLTGDGSTTPENLLAGSLDIMSGVREGKLRIGLADLDGGNTISTGKTNLVELDGNWQIEHAIVSDINHQSINALSSIASSDDLLPAEYALDQNYPNPFNPSTNINFSLPVASNVRLDIFNMLGQNVTTLVDEYMEAGEHIATWNAGNSASGVYFYRLTAGDFVARKKMILLK